MSGSAPSRPEEDGPPSRPALSVVVPAYGEERRIGATLAALRAGLGSSGPVELIVVDDGSSDGTAAAAAAAGADQVIRLPANRGKGAAVRAGMLAARGRVLVFTDADLSYRPAEVARVVAEIGPGVDVAVGSRRAETERGRAGAVRDLSHRLFQRLTGLAVQGRYGDTQCGLKAFSERAGATVFAAARVDGFAFDVEIFLIAERRGLTIRQVPVEAAAAEGSTVRLGVHAAEMVRDLLRLRRWARQGRYDPAVGGGPQGGGPDGLR